MLAFEEYSYKEGHLGVNGTVLCNYTLGETIMILHYAANSRAVRVAWLLEELEIRYDIKKYSLGDKEMRLPEYLKINPLGRVPVLQDKDITISESGAIIQYLLTKYAENQFVPKIQHKNFSSYLQWFHFAEGMIMPQMNIIVVETIFLPPERQNETNLKRATKLLSKMLEAVESHMSDREYLAGELSGADMMTGHAIIMSEKLGIDFTDKPNLKAYTKRLMKRPALQKAWHL